MIFAEPPKGATTHLQAIGVKHEEVLWVDRKANGPSKKSGKRSDRSESLSERKNTQLRKLKCKFCSQSHIMKKELCPAWGKRCNVCGKINHWKGSEFCRMKEKVRSVNHDYDCSDSDSDVASVKTLNALVNGVASKKDKPIYCELYSSSNPVRLQVDCGATVSIIPRSCIGDIQLEPSNVSLEMWNKTKTKALGTCQLLLDNLKP